MKRKITFVALVLFALALASVAPAKEKESQSRLLSGQVTNRAEAPIANAVVYLKNTKTLTVKTYITDASGGYRFPELSPNIDYEVHAEYQGAKSETRTLSSFDSRLRPVMNLKVDAGK